MRLRLRRDVRVRGELIVGRFRLVVLPLAQQHQRPLSQGARLRLVQRLQRPGMRWVARNQLLQRIQVSGAVARAARKLRQPPQRLAALLRRRRTIDELLVSRGGRWCVAGRFLVAGQREHRLGLRRRRQGRRERVVCQLHRPGRLARAVRDLRQLQTRVRRRRSVRRQVLLERRLGALAVALRQRAIGQQQIGLPLLLRRPVPRQERLTVDSRAVLVALAVLDAGQLPHGVLLLFGRSPQRRRRVDLESLVGLAVGVQLVGQHQIYRYRSGDRRYGGRGARAVAAARREERRYRGERQEESKREPRPPAPPRPHPSLRLPLPLRIR